MTTIDNRGREVTIRHDLADRDHVMFAGVETAGNVELFTADELRELADEMEQKTDELVNADERAAAYADAQTGTRGEGHELDWSRACPGLPSHGDRRCDVPPIAGDRYCATCRAEFDSQAALSELYDLETRTVPGCASEHAEDRGEI